MDTSGPVLEVARLGIDYRVGRQWLPAVREVTLAVLPGEIVGIVGESGSGKSTVAAGVMQYLPPNGRMAPASSVRLLGDELKGRSRRALQQVWGARMALVPQNPGAALDPAMRVGEQAAEILRHHQGMSRSAARARVLSMFERVSLPDPPSVYRRYPHELSGGMQQRLVIAMALLTAPHLLILDEPTTALDVTTEAVILDLVRDVIAEGRAGALYVTHNLGVVAQLCARVIVMYAGEVMEAAPVGPLFAAPRHPYTIGLLASVPRLGATRRSQPLQAIPGRAPALNELPQGCVFAPRCPLAVALCQTRPVLERLPDGREVRCHRWQALASGELALLPAAMLRPAEQQAREDVAAELLAVRALARHYPVRRTLPELLRGDPPRPVRAVDGVTLAVGRGQTVGLVGESGSGKTTLARVISGLETRSSGTITLLGAELPDDVRQRPRDVLARLQMVFQNPQDSLNPYLTVGQAIRRPLQRLRGMRRAEADAEVERLLLAVNLRPELAARYPGELSGGEKQRVAIARAFASDPALILCDEPVSALDVSVQAAVLTVLADLQDQRDTAYLFISHDLAVVGYLADRIAVMYLGALVEIGRGEDLFHPPYHPYTEALVSAIPVPDPARQIARVRLADTPPSARAIPSGCRFHPRCPRKLGAICEQQAPPWQHDGAQHWIHCHIPLAELAAAQGAIGGAGED